MRTMTVGIAADERRTIADAKAHAIGAFRTGQYQGEFYTFSSLAQLFEFFTPKRWELIQKLHDTGPSSLRGLARAVGRDVKRVHEDVAMLLKEGIVERNDANKLFVPFENIRIDVDLARPAAA